MNSKHGNLMLNILIVFFVLSLIVPKCVFSLENLPKQFLQQLKKAVIIEDIYQPSESTQLAHSDTIFLGDITYLYITKDNRRATIDRANRTPLAFDNAGRFINRIGNSGEGPGEFKRASAICFDEAQQTWYVADNSLRKISLFTNSGEYLREFKISSGTHEMQIDGNGRLYLFMPNKRKGGMIECLNGDGDRINSFLNSELMQELPFSLYSGGFCLAKSKIIAAPALCSEISYFDYEAHQRFKLALDNLTGYISPPNLKNITNVRTFMSSFTSIIKILLGPFETVLVYYGKSIDGEKPSRYFAFLSLDGRELASGIVSTALYFTSDFRGNLYSVAYPEEEGNPIIKKWTLKNFSAR